MLCNLTSLGLTLGAETSFHPPCSVGMLALKVYQITQMSPRDPHYQQLGYVGIVEFEVLIVVVMKSSIFWDIMSCSPLKVN
jgi:hypothetical protein